MTARLMTEEAYEAHQARVHAPSAFVNAAVAPQLTLLELRTVFLELPMPPSVNEAWHHVESTGGKALTDEHRQFRTNVISNVRRVMRRDGPLLGRIECTLLLCFADRRRTDIDNRVKPTFDALTKAKAYADDSQIDRLVLERIIVEGAREWCSVTLREIAT